MKVYIVIVSRIPEDGERYQRIHSVFTTESDAQQCVKDLMIEYIDVMDLDQLPDGGNPNSGEDNWNALARRATKRMGVKKLKNMIYGDRADWSQPRWSIHEHEVKEGSV